MELLGIILGIAAAVFLLSLVSLHRRRRRRTYTQTMTIPAFTDSMPPARIHEAARVAQVAADARLILHTRYRGHAASRREMESRGVTQRRWAEAVKLLRDLHIVGPHGVPQVSERVALRRVRHWQDRQTQRVGASPAYVAGH